MKLKIAAALVAALMVLAVLPAGAHDLPDSVEVDGRNVPYGLVAGSDTPTYAPAEVTIDGETVAASTVVRFFIAGGENIDHHGRHAGGTDDCGVWLGGFPGWVGGGAVPGYKAHDPAADLFGLADDTNLDSDPDTDGVQPYDASATWEGLSHPRASDSCYEGYVADPSPSPYRSPGTIWFTGGKRNQRSGSAHLRNAVRGTLTASDFYQPFWCSLPSECLVLIDGTWRDATIGRSAAGQFIYRLS